MKKILLLISLCCLINYYGQNQIEWVLNSVGDAELSSGQEWGKEIAKDSYGNIYSMGVFSTPSIQFGNVTLTNTTPVFGSNNTYLVKMNPAGEAIWGKSFGNNFDFFDGDLITDHAGNVYMCGTFSQTVSFDGIILSGNLQDPYIVKLNQNGEVLWAKNLQGIEDDGGTALAVDLNNNVYFGGNFASNTLTLDGFSVYNTNTWSKFFISKLDPDGNTLWLKENSAGGLSESIFDLATDAQNNLFAVGEMRSLSFQFAGSALTNTSMDYANTFLLKYDTNGNEIWGKAPTANTSSNQASAIAIDSNDKIYISGHYAGDATFQNNSFPSSPGVGKTYVVKFDENGSDLWIKSFGGSQYQSIALDQDQDVIIGSSFMGNQTFGDTSFTNDDFAGILVVKLNASDGEFVWANTVESTYNNYVYGIVCDSSDNIYVAGSLLGGFGTQSITDFDMGPNVYNISVEDDNAFIFKLIQKGVTGTVFLDLNENCIFNITETRLENKTLLINPGNIVVEANDNGVWTCNNLSPGDYTVTVDTTNMNWILTCPQVQAFTVTDQNVITQGPNFGFVSSSPCIAPSETIVMPFMRPCFTDQAVFVQACNTTDATAIIYNAYSVVSLDSNLIFESASLPFTDLGNNQYRFNHGNLYPNQCVDFTISAQVGCDVLIGQTICLEALLYPVSTCALDTNINALPDTISPCNTPYDLSHLVVVGACLNDSIVFTVTNTSAFGHMSCYTPINIYIDGVLFLLDSVKLDGGETATFSFLGDGRTWRLEAFQHPFHPGNSFPSATVENCNPGNWTPGLVTIFPENDVDPHVSIYCDVASASYDPNDKRGFPLGVSSENFIASNQDLEYIIRFQNTGTDTAFTIVVRDTLDTDLNIFTVNPGAASHGYSFRMYGPRVLEWTFNNILLPDSTTNEIKSHGFASFSVSLNPNLEEGTLIENDADIYFDFNEPIITNMTNHKVNYQYNKVNKVPALNKKANDVKIYPNPSSALFYISMSTKVNQTSYRVTNLSGQLVESKSNISGQQFQVDLSSQAKGMYLLDVRFDGRSEIFKIIKE